MSSPHHVPVSFEESSSGGDRHGAFWDFDSVPTLRGWGAVCLSVCLPFFYFPSLFLTCATTSLRHDWTGPLSLGRHMTPTTVTISSAFAHLRVTSLI